MLSFLNMEKNSDCKPCLFRSGWHICLALAIGVLILSGCSKAKQPAAETTPPSVENTTQPTDAVQTPVKPSAPIAVVPAPNGQPDLAELNRSLLRWIIGHKRPPANFEDFAASAGVVIPPPPAGKKYFIAKNMHIQLVSQ